MTATVAETVTLVLEARQERATPLIGGIPMVRRGLVGCALLSLFEATAACSGSHVTDADADAGAPVAVRLDECDGVPECALVVRLDYTTHVPLGWRAVGGAYRWGVASDMSAQAGTVLGFAFAPTPAEVTLPPFTRTRVAEFYVAPGDLGGMALFHATTGQLLFAGHIVWAGRGDILAPTEWRAAGDIRAATGVALGPAWGRDETGTLGNAEAAAIADPARATNLGAALAARTAGSRVAAHLFFYPRSVGALDPRTAEWIVVLTSDGLTDPSLPPGAPCDADHCGGCCDGATCRRGDESTGCGTLGDACLTCTGACDWQTAPASCGAGL